jgi:hypothetical protein
VTLFTPGQVKSKGVTDTNDILPALAQGWFGCILAEDRSLFDFVI